MEVFSPRERERERDRLGFIVQITELINEIWILNNLPGIWKNGNFVAFYIELRVVPHRFHN